MFLAKKILASLLLPPTSLLLLALAGLWLAGRRPRAGRALAAISCGLLFLLSEPWLADRLAAGLETVPPATLRELGRAQAIVILDGGRYRLAPEFAGADTVNWASLERLRYGASLARQTGLPVLVTGGAPFGGRPGAAAMRDVLEHDFQVPVRWVEPASRDTAENAAYSEPLLRQAGIVRIALVTHAFHMRRAAWQFRRRGFEVVPAPLGFSSGHEWPAAAMPSAEALERSSRTLREWLGLLAAGGLGDG